MSTKKIDPVSCKSALFPMNLVTESDANDSENHIAGTITYATNIQKSTTYFLDSVEDPANLLDASNIVSGLLAKGNTRRANDINSVLIMLKAEITPSVSNEIEDDFRSADYTIMRHSSYRMQTSFAIHECSFHSTQHTHYIACVGILQYSECSYVPTEAQKFSTNMVEWDRRCWEWEYFSFDWTC